MAKQYINTDTGEEDESVAGLQGVNKTKDGAYKNVVSEDTNPDNITDPAKLAEYKASRAFINEAVYNPNKATTDEVGDVVQGVGGNGFGESKYDTAVKSPEDLEDLENVRADEQPWYDKVGAGILKGTILAGTTIADGLVGTVAGLGNLALNGTMNSFVENPFSIAMQDINKWSETALPNYLTDQEKQNSANGEWYKNAFTANFLGEQFKNLGFIVGAGIVGEITGGLASSMMGLGDARLAFEGASALTKEGSAAMDALITGDQALDSAKITEQLISSAQKIKTAEPIVKLSAGLAGSLGWARQSAITDSRDWFDAQMAKIGNDRQDFSQKSENALLQNDEYTTIQETGDPTNPYTKVLNPEGQALLDQEVSKRYDGAVAKITDDRIKMSNIDFGINLPLLTAAELFQFGKAFAGGYKNARKLAPFITKSIDGEVVGDASKEAFSDAIASGTASYEAKLPSLGKKIYDIAKNPIVAGTQLMNMSAVSTGIGNIYGEDLDNFLAGKATTNATQPADDSIRNIGKALVQGAKDVYGDPSKWEQFWIGAVTGVVGIPGFKPKSEVEGADNSLWSRKTMNGGIWDPMREQKEDAKQSTELVAKLNQRIKDPNFVNLYQGIARHTYLENAKDEAAQNADEFAFKNFEHSQIVSDAVLFDKAGRMQDLYDNIDKASNITLDDVKQVRTLSTNPTTGKSTFDGTTNDQDVIDQVKAEGNDTRKVVDNYRKIADAIKVKTGGRLGDDETEELTWMMTKIDNWQDRFDEMHKDIKDRSNNLFEILGNKTYKDEEGIEQPYSNLLDVSPVAMLQRLQGIHLGEIAALHSKINDEDANDAQDELNNQQAIINDKTNRGKRIPKTLTTKIQDLQQAISDNKEASVKFADIPQKLEDMQRLAAARIDFITKYDGYMKNPEGLTAALAKVKADIIKQTTDKDTKEINDKVNASKTYADFKAVIKAAPIATRRQIIDRAIADKNPIAIEYDKVSKGITDMKASISSLSGYTKEQRDLALKILNSKTPNIEDINTLINPSTYSKIDDENVWVDPKTQAVTSQEQMEVAQRILGQAATEAAKSNATRAKIQDLNESEIVAENNPIIPDKEIPAKPQPTPLIGGAVEPKDVVDSNNTLSEEMKPLNTTASTNRQWLQVVHEINLDKYKANKDIVFIGDDTSKVAYKAVYDYVKDNGGFDYVNSGKLKENSKVSFMIDPEWIDQDPETRNGTVFIMQDGKVLGAIDKSVSRVPQFGGMAEARDRMWKEFSERDKGTSSKDNSTEIQDIETRRQQELEKEFKGIDLSQKSIDIISERGDDKAIKFMEKYDSINAKYDEELDKLKESSSSNDKSKFITSETNEVAKVYPGRIQFNKTQGKSLSHITGVATKVDDTHFKASDDVIFGVMQKGEILTNDPSVNKKIQKINGLAANGGNNEGRLYLLVKGADGQYYPTLVKTKRFNSTEFNLNDADIQKTDLYKKIMGVATRMAEAVQKGQANDDTVTTPFYNELSSYLYLGDYKINANESGEKEGIIYIRKDTPDAGPKIPIDVFDRSKIVEPEEDDDFSSDKPLSAPPTLVQREAALKETARPIEDVAKEILEAIQKDGTYVQIDRRLLNDTATDKDGLTYNDRLISDNLLSSNLEKLGVVGAGFLMKAKDAEGKTIDEAKPETKEVKEPAVVMNEVKGTEVHYATGTYNVTPDGKIFNDKGNEVDQLTESKSQIIKDLAWIKTDGKGTGIKVSWDGKAKEANYYLCPLSGRVLKINDNKTFSYVTSQHEEIAIKDKLKAKAKQGVVPEVKTPITPTTPVAPIVEGKKANVITNSKIIFNTPSNDVEVRDHTNIVKGNMQPKFEDLNTSKDTIGYYTNKQDQIVKSYVRPLGTFNVNGEIITMHMTKEFVVNKSGESVEAFVGIIDSNGKQVGSGSTVEALRNMLNNNKDRVLSESKIETALTKNQSKPTETAIPTAPSETTETTVSQNPIPQSPIESDKTSKESLPPSATTSKPIAPKEINSPDEPLGDDLMSSANTKPRPRKHSEVNTKIWEPWNPEREMAQLSKILPKVVSEHLVDIHRGLIQISKGGAEAWGVYKDGLITVSDIASKGTIFHEAFHLVFDKFLDKIGKSNLFTEAKNKWGDLGEDSLEEKMADAYKQYTLTEMNDKSLGGKIIRFFKSIFGLSKANMPMMDQFFWDINRGKFADKEITNDSDFITENYNKSWKEDSSKSNKTTSFALKTKPNEKFELVKDHEDDYYSVHFKTNQGILSTEEKSMLFQKVADNIPIGGKLATWGEVSKGGFSGLNKFKTLGFEESGETREVIDKDTKKTITIPVLIKTKEITSNSKKNSVKSLDNSDNLHTFVNLDSNTRRLLSLKGIDSDVWSNLSEKEKSNELKCVTI